MSTSFWIHPVGNALGGIKRDVALMVAENGEVREGFLARTGFKTIYQSPKEQTGLDLALEALSDLDVEWMQQNVDTVIYVTSTGNRAAPGNGHLLHGELALAPHALVLDLNDACTGFVRSVILGNSLLASGTSKVILLVISDTYSKLYDDSNLRVSPLFSDGASAMILSKDNLTIPGLKHRPRRWEILGTTVISDGRRADELTVTRGNEDFPLGELAMNGAGVFNFVLNHLAPSVAETLSQAGLEATQIDKWYVHQGSRAVVDAVSKSLSLDANAQFVSADYGNVVGSAIPFQIFAETEEQEKSKLPVRETQNLFLLAFGVGLTLAGATIRQSKA